MGDPVVIEMGVVCGSFFGGLRTRFGFVGVGVVVVLVDGQLCICQGLGCSAAVAGLYVK